MKWRRSTDYHGTRSYNSDELAAGPSAWFMNIGRRLRDLRKPFTQPTSTRVLLSEGERHFSLLGTSSGTSPLQRPDDCPFPTRASDHNQRDWRVLP